MAVQIDSDVVGGVKLNILYPFNTFNSFFSLQLIHFLFRILCPRTQGGGGFRAKAPLKLSRPRSQALGV